MTVPINIHYSGYRKILLTGYVLLSFLQGQSQSSSADTSDTPKHVPHTLDISPPYLPGGEMALIKFITENFRLPAGAADTCIGTVLISFTVNLDGSTTDHKIEKGLIGCDSCEAEALRVSKLLTGFKPAVLRRSKTPVAINMVVPFRITADVLKVSRTSRRE
jgi:hypothetical protein